jgi:hypothetical protein
MTNLLEQNLLCLPIWSLGLLPVAVRHYDLAIQTNVESELFVKELDVLSTQAVDTCCYRFPKASTFFYSLVKELKYALLPCLTQGTQLYLFGICGCAGALGVLRSILYLLHRDNLSSLPRNVGTLVVTKEFLIGNRANMLIDTCPLSPKGHHATPLR